MLNYLLFSEDVLPYHNQGRLHTLSSLPEASASTFFDSCILPHLLSYLTPTSSVHLPSPFLHDEQLRLVLATAAHLHIPPVALTSTRCHYL